MVSFIISYTFGRVRKVSHFSRSPPLLLLLLLLPLSNGWWTVVFRCAPRRMNFKSCSLDRKKIFQGWILAGRFRYERIKFIINFPPSLVEGFEDYEKLSLLELSGVSISKFSKSIPYRVWYSRWDIGEKSLSKTRPSNFPTGWPLLSGWKEVESILISFCSNSVWSMQREKMHDNRGILEIRGPRPSGNACITSRVFFFFLMPINIYDIYLVKED